MARDHSTEVAIVGAGLAGLAAATALAARDVNVSVLEARDRVGGRTFTHRVNGAVLDLGGQWIGPRQDRIKKLVADFGLQTFATHDEGKKVLARGRKVSTYSGTMPRLGPNKLLAMQRAISKIDKLAKRTSLPDWWEGKSASKWDGLTLEAWKRENVRTAAARDIFDSAVRVVFGADPSEISFLYFLAYTKMGGGLMSLVETRGGAQETRFAEGSQQVAERLAADLGDRVVTGSPVRAVEIDSRGVTLRTDHGSVGTKLVVMAVPPALVARVSFEPALPPPRAALAQRFPMGATIKCHLLYERAFWREHGLSGEAVFTEGPVSVVFDNSAEDGSEPALLAFVVGSEARRLGALKRDDRAKEVLDAVVRAFGDEASHPKGYIEKDWATDEWTRGCPTGFMPPGAATSFGPALRHPVGPIHWAGTETAREWAGYMEGALESGERVAEEVLARL